MENPNFFPAVPRHKRKLDDSDAVLQLLHGVSISPGSKKMRQDFGSTSYSNDYFPNVTGVPAFEVEFHDQLSNEMLLTPPDIELPEQMVKPLPSAPLNDERAIVLYKPVNPPLFPGGPNAGSQLLLNARMLPTGILNASNFLKSRKEDDLSSFHVPKSGGKAVDLSEEEATNQRALVQDNRLAVVPWGSNSNVNMLALQTTAPPSEVDIDEMSADDETLGVEAMEEDIELGNNFVNSQSSNSSSSFCYEPWQNYGTTPQPQCSSLMWSH